MNYLTKYSLNKASTRFQNLLTRSACISMFGFFALMTSPTKAQTELPTCTNDRITNVSDDCYFGTCISGLFYPLNGTSTCRNTFGDGARYHSFAPFNLMPSLRFTYEENPPTYPVLEAGLNCNTERAARVGLMPPFGGAGVTTSMHPVSLTGSWSGNNFQAGDAFLVSTCGAKDLLLSTNNSTARIKLFTTPTTTPGTQVERMTILNDGKVGIGTYKPLGRLDVNVGGDNNNLPKVSFTSGATVTDPTSQPQIRLYSPSGVSYLPDDRATSYSWYIHSQRQYQSACFAGLNGVIDNSNSTTQGALHFRAGYDTGIPGDLYSSTIGTEGSVARLSLLSNGNVGVNNEVPMVRFQVSDGTVLFNGSIGDTPKKRIVDIATFPGYAAHAEEIGAGTRLMWIPSKVAFRAGIIDNYVEQQFSIPSSADPDWYSGVTLPALIAAKQDAWNSSKIGQYSYAFGRNSRAEGEDDIAIGLNNVANSGSYHNSIAIGQANKSTGENSISMGYGSRASGQYSLAIGAQAQSTGFGTIAIGWEAKAIPSSYHGSIAIGHEVTSTGIDAISMGYHNTASGDYSGALGEYCQATAGTSFAIGQSCISSGVSAFSAGNSNQATGSNSVVLSSGSQATGTNSIAIGSSVNATANYSMSLGTESDASNLGSITLGEHLTSNDNYGILIGHGISDATRLTSSNSNSLGVGFLSDVPTLVVGPASGSSGSVGKVGIGLGMTAPVNRLDVSGGVVIGSGGAYAGSAVAPTNGLIIQGQTVIGGTTAVGAYDLTVNSAFMTTGAGLWSFSDRNLKKDITEFTDGLATIKQINTVKYHYNGKFGADTTEEHIGIIAQDVKKIAPYTVKNTAFETKKITKPSQIIEKGHLDSTAIISRDTCNGVVTESKSYLYKYVSEREFVPEVVEVEKGEYLAYNPSALTYITVNAIKELDANLTSTNANVKFVDSMVQSIQTESKKLQSENIALNERMKAIASENILNIQRIKELEDKVQQIQTTCCKNADLYEDVLLEQNAPNPFNKETIVTYFIPSRLSGRIELVIADATGNAIIQSIPVQTNIPSQYTFSATDLQTGVYAYGIAVNGQIVKSKKMMIIK